MLTPLNNLQRLLEKNEWFLIPRTDAFHGEYIAPQDERLAWVSGFTGSAGLGLINSRQAFLFVDGRYTLQATAETDPLRWQIIPLARQSVEDFLNDNLPLNQILSLDPWLHTYNDYSCWQALLKPKKSTLKLCSRNPIDTLWHDRPCATLEMAVPHSFIFAGESSPSKRERVWQQVSKEADIILLTDCHSIAWLLNIRGGDLTYTPIVHSYALLHRDHSVDLFVDLRKISPQLKDFLGKDIRYHPIETMVPYLYSLPSKSIIIDPASAPLALVKALMTQNRAPIFHKDPSLLLRAVKNASEIIGFMSAHLRDGVALVRFFCWLTQHPSPETLSELKIAERLEALRREGVNFRGLSFNTISAVGPNAAIIHYSPKPSTARLLDRHSLYLCDSGAQYLDGTTDVTRTIALGQPTAEQRKHFTLVLKGHIALARACFPYGTTGGQLDVLARQYLWQEKLDYSHGTGHGVGSYLSVHEGPQRISSAGFQQKLLPGMIISNEPGYYKEGAYGIRLESLVLVKTSRISSANWLEFQTLTLAPIDLQLIEASLLSPEEKVWLNDYHRLIYDSLASWLDEPARKWLAHATAAV